MSKSAVQTLFDKIRHRFDKDTEDYEALVTDYVLAKQQEIENIKEAFNAGNQDNFYNKDGKAAEKYYNDNYGNI